MFSKKFLALMTAGMVFLAGCGAATDSDTDEVAGSFDGEITIGGQFPLTGELAAIGNGQKNGALLAVKEVNAAGGIQGKELKMVVEDDQCDQTLAVSAFNKLASSNQVPAVVGPACSPSLLAVAPIAEKDQVVAVSPSATSKDITTKGSAYTYRTAPSDSLRMQKLAEFAVEELAEDKLAVIYLNNDYGINAKDDFVAKFKELGGEVVFEDAFNRGAIDYKTQLQKVKDSGATGLYHIAYPEGSGLLHKQTKELGVEVTMFSGLEAPDDPQLAEIAKDSHNRTWYAGFKASDDSFAEAYKAEYGEDPVTYAAESYDAVMVLAETMKKGKFTGAEIQATLGDIQDYEGASGTFSFDANGDVQKEFNLVQIEDEKPKVIRAL